MALAATAFAKLAARPRLASLALGVVAATGLQPLALWPLTLAALALFVAIQGRIAHARDTAISGWLFGLGYFTVGNSWIATAFTYQAAMPALLGWFAVPLLSLYLAIYHAFAAWAARHLAGRRLGWPLAFALAGAWIVGEWLRGWLFTGFAWNPIGIVLLGGFEAQGLAALAPWLGTYALSGLAILLAAAIAIMVHERAFVPLGLVSGLLVAAMHIPAGAGEQGELALTLVQPDLRQDDLGDPSLFEAQFANIAGLSLPREADRKRIVLWPESALPDYLREGYPQRYYDQLTARGDPVFARRRIGRLIGPGSVLMTGAVDLVIKDGRAAAAHNSITVLDSSGAIVGSYAKAHLVPYGEYLPMRALLEPLGARRLVAGALDFLPGPGPKTVDLGPWGKAGMQVCYEITFPGAVVDPQLRPDYIFNPSNDGWFGRWGPPQHLAHARLRAVEEGLPVLRATTTGISAVIDARGIVRDHIPPFQAARVDSFVPPAHEPTLFARWGNALSLAWAGLLVLLALVARGRAPR